MERYKVWGQVRDGCGHIVSDWAVTVKASNARVAVNRAIHDRFTRAVEPKNHYDDGKRDAELTGDNSLHVEVMLDSAPASTGAGR